MTDAAAKIAARKEMASQVGALYKFVLGGDGGGTWLVDLRADPSIQEADGAAQCSITMTASDFVAMMTNEVAPQDLFFGGKLQIDGDIMLAMKLQALPPLLAS